MSCWVAGDCVSHPACCAMVMVGFQSVKVSSPLYRGHTSKWSEVSSSAWPQMHLVYPAVVSGEEGKLLEGELESGFL